jgi:hypothetical protein
MSSLDKYKQAWRSQSCGNFDMDPAGLLKIARIERRVILMMEMVVISILFIIGIVTLWQTIRSFPQSWPWLIYAACLLWVVGFMLFKQWHRRRYAAHYDEPMLAHVEWSIKDMEHRMWQDRNSFWWYIVPIALGCMIPPTISFGMDFLRTQEWAVLWSLLGLLVFFAAVFAFVHMTMKWAGRAGREAQRRELQALKALRDSLLNEGSTPQVPQYDGRN